MLYRHTHTKWSPYSSLHFIPRAELKIFVTSFPIKIITFSYGIRLSLCSVCTVYYFLRHCFSHIEQLTTSAKYLFPFWLPKGFCLVRCPATEWLLLVKFPCNWSEHCLNTDNESLFLLHLCVSWKISGQALDFFLLQPAETVDE